MCVKEFIGYTCGHCAVPHMIRCPLAEQNDMFPYCKFPAERPLYVPEMCHPCSRVMWNKRVLADEEAHKKEHQNGVCECEVVFDEEERLRRRPGRGKGGRKGAAAGASRGLETRGQVGGLMSHGPRHSEPDFQFLGHRMVELSFGQPDVQLGFHPTHGNAHGMVWYPEESHYDSIIHRSRAPGKRPADPGTASVACSHLRQRHNYAQFAQPNLITAQVSGEPMSIVAEDSHTPEKALTIGIEETNLAPVLEDELTFSAPVTVSGEMLLDSYWNPPPRSASAPPH